MIPGISSQIFLPRRLDTTLLDILRGGGARAIELWSARYHVDYTDRAQVRELGRWFSDTGTLATMHMPRTTDTEFSRHASPGVNLLDPDRGRRIDAMDEVKRALEMAETIAMQSCVLHLGGRDSAWGEQALELAVRAVEHLKAFAGPLGVRLLLENLQNDVTAPAHLLEILRAGHFDTCGFCLDIGHAFACDGIDSALETMRPRLHELHVYDTTGKPGSGAHTEDHLWPASGSERPAWAMRGSIDEASGWAELYGKLATLPAATVSILEVHYSQAPTPEAAGQVLNEILRHQARLLDEGEQRTQRFAT
jgi:sugar phosphate isomerase/epimerase